MVVVDHYKVLGVDHKASPEQIKKAYHTLAKKFHPDKNKNAGAEDKFKSISTSYAVLCDINQRRVFDMQREADIEDARLKRSQPKKQPRKSESQTSTQSESSSTGWERFRTHEYESWRSAYPSADHFFNASTQSSARTSKPKRHQDTATNSRRHSDFSFTNDRPSWDAGTSTQDDFFDDIDNIFDEILKKEFRGFRKASRAFKFMFGSMMDDNDEDNDDDGFTTEWFTIGENGETKKTTANDQKSPLDDIWDWSKPMFDSNRRTNLYSPRRMCFVLLLVIKITREQKIDRSKLSMSICHAYCAKMIFSVI